MTTPRFLVLVALAGCGGVATDPSDDSPDAGTGDDADADAAPPEPGVDASMALGPWHAPVRIDALSTNAYVDSYPTVRDDGREMYFVSDRDGGSQDIYVSIRFEVTEPWGPPTKVVELDVASSTESGPDLSGDGKTIWFSRNVTTSTTGMDLFTASRDSTSEPWGAVTPVTELNTAFHERSPHVTANGRTMYFASDVTGDYEIYRATRSSVTAPWGAPQLMTRLNSNATDESTSTTADGLEIYIDSRRDGTLATYRSSKSPDGGAWSIPEVVPELAGGYRADVSGDGRYMVLSAQGDTGTSDIFEAWR
jgi:hypothetical protein